MLVFLLTVIAFLTLASFYHYQFPVLTNCVGFLVSFYRYFYSMCFSPPYIFLLSSTHQIPQQICFPCCHLWVFPFHASPTRFVLPIAFFRDDHFVSIFYNRFHVDCCAANELLLHIVVHLIESSIVLLLPSFFGAIS